MTRDLVAPGRRAANPVRRAALTFAVLCGAGGAAHADNFARVYYDARTDELVVTMSYRGTNPDHAFSLQWGPCQTRDDGSPAEVVAQVLDSQAGDVASQPFRKTTRFGLADLPCRPAKLTLRTAPRFYVSLQIPAGSP